MKAVVNEKEEEEESMRPKYYQARDIVLNVNGAVLYNKESENFERITCIRVEEVDEENKIDSARDIIKTLNQK